MYTTINEFKLTSKFGLTNEARFIHRSKDEVKTNRKQQLFEIDAPTDDDVIKEDGLTPYKNTLNTDYIEWKLRAKKPFFIIGHAGWGKTSIIKSIAKAHGLSVITVYLDKALPEDLGGIPITSKGKNKQKIQTYWKDFLEKNPNITEDTEKIPNWAEYIISVPSLAETFKDTDNNITLKKWAEYIYNNNEISTDTSYDNDMPVVVNALPQWAQHIYENPEDDFLVFFDEMNQASPDVQNALMPILLENIIGGIKFDNIWFGAAGNYAEENASISDLSAPLRSRFVKEKVWNESWEEAFDHIIENFTDKLPEDLLNVVIHNNICLNPRELSRMLSEIISNKQDTKKWPIESVQEIISDFNKLDKTAEAKKISEAVFNFLNTNTTSATTAAPKKTQINRPVLSQARINEITKLIKQGGFINAEAEFIDLSNESTWGQTLGLTPEEIELIKRSL